MKKLLMLLVVDICLMNAQEPPLNEGAGFQDLTEVYRNDQDGSIVALFKRNAAGCLKGCCQKVTMVIKKRNGNVTSQVELICEEPNCGNVPKISQHSNLAIVQMLMNRIDRFEAKEESDSADWCIIS